MMFTYQRVFRASVKKIIWLILKYILHSSSFKASQLGGHLEIASELLFTIMQVPEWANRKISKTVGQDYVQIKYFKSRIKSTDNGIINLAQIVHFSG